MVTTFCGQEHLLLKWGIFSQNPLKCVGSKTLSDSDYAALTREAMLYSLDKDCDDYEIHKKSDDTDIYSSLDYEDIDFGEILSFD
ncbi:hypothetical protein DXC23_06920 [Eubacterium sp. OM08-24]|uniref:hypothetical protein n=1 Tax=Eubacterium sp. OM08-24 TaxID=2292352 RepID=UPI000E43A0BC|nr:hypothetical protein [Eubacterium sp. OM08-24]RGM19454.1 hypothetical protein DXC23_06920 [Eubacterium sp. OM08-24]